MKKVMSVFLSFLIVTSITVFPQSKLVIAYNPYDTNISLHIRPTSNDLWDVHPFYDTDTQKWYMFYVTPTTWISKLMVSSDMLNWVETPIYFNGTPQQSYYALGVIKDQLGEFKTYFGNSSVSAQSYSSDLLNWNWGGYGAEIPTNMSVWTQGSLDPYLFYNSEDNTYNVANTGVRSSSDNSIALTKSNGLTFSSWGTQTELRRFNSGEGVPECSQLSKIGNCWYLTAAFNIGGLPGGTNYWIGDANTPLSQINWTNKATCTQLTNANLKTAQIAKGQDGKSFLFGFINGTSNINLPLEVYQLPDTRLGAKLSTDISSQIRGPRLASRTSNGTFAGTYGRFDISSTVTVSANSAAQLRITKSTAYTDVVLSTVDNSVSIKNKSGVDFGKIYVDAGQLTNANIRIIQEGNIMEVYVNDIYHLVAKIDRSTNGDTITTSAKSGTANFSEANIYELKSASQMTKSVNKISLNTTSASLLVNHKLNLMGSFTPYDATNKNATWSSSNTNIATVSTRGIVTAVAVGTATITATTSDGGKTATCSITVSSGGGNIDNDFENGWPSGWCTGFDGYGFSIVDVSLNKELKPNTTTDYNSIYFGEYLTNMVFEFNYKPNQSTGQNFGGASLRCGASRYDVAISCEGTDQKRIIIYRAGIEVASNTDATTGRGVPALPRYTWSNVKIVLESGHFRVYVDNLLTVDYTDSSPLTSGGFGLRSAWADVSYDNVKCYPVSSLNFDNDFENGWPTGWYTGGEGSGFSIVDVSSNHELKSNSTTDYSALYFGQYVANMVYEFKYKPNQATGQNFGGASLRCGSSKYDVAISCEGTDQKRVIIYRAGAEVASNTDAISGRGVPALPRYTWSNVKIVLEGGHIRVFIDNLLTVDYTDSSPLTSGGLGLRSATTDVSYDNIVCYPLGELDLSILSSFNFNSISPIAKGTFIGRNAINITVPYGTNVTSLVANFTTTASSVVVGSTTQISGTTTNNFTTPVTYILTASDGSIQTYVVTVAIASNPAKEITKFNFVSPAVSGTIGIGRDITVTVPYNTNVTALIATFTTNGTTVEVGSTTQISGTTANNFTSPVNYTITAADGSTQSYTVTVTKGSSSTAKNITEFSFDGLNPPVIAYISTYAISATVPYGTNVTTLVANFKTTGNTVKIGTTTQVSGTTANDFSTSKSYIVTATGGTTKTYVVTVTVLSNPAKDITAFSFNSLSPVVNATINGTSIIATVPTGTNVTALVATFTKTGSSVKVGTTTQTSGITANNFTSPVIYTVTAADGSTKNYTVTVNFA